MGLPINLSEIYPEDRNQQFLINSTALEDVNLSQKTAEIKGYHQALQKTIQIGCDRKDLTLDMINTWTRLITQNNSSISSDVQKKAAELFANLNKQIKKIENAPNDVDVVSLLGDYLYKFHQLNLFPDSKRRINLLFLNYMVCRFRRPLIVITLTEKEALINGEQNPLLMKAFIAEKVREVVLSSYGELLKRLSHPKSGQASEIYLNDENEKQIIEWHALLAAKSDWQKQAEGKK